MNYVPVIGLELHIQVNTKSKMFSAAPNNFGDEPNTNISAYDFALPGTLPLVNKQVVVDAIKVCHLLHMNIEKKIIFDRKNYFYSDLPKGYQITQHFHPIGTDGYLDIDVDGKQKRIAINELHMEEDACKQIHDDSYTYLDFNRAGIPLLEIVTAPVFTNGQEARAFVEAIRNIVTSLKVSDGKMEEGSLRCDVNISLRPENSDVLDTKIEIKNVNTLVNIQRAIDFEVSRQKGLKNDGLPIIPETRRFDEKKKETIRMRFKTEDIDYQYFTDPNILPILLDDDFISRAIEEIDSTNDFDLDKQLFDGVDEKYSSIIEKNSDLHNLFRQNSNQVKDKNLLAQWIAVNAFKAIRDAENKNDIIENLSLFLADFIDAILSNELTKIQQKDLFNYLLLKKGSIQNFLENMTTLIDNNRVVVIVNNIIHNNPNAVNDYKNGKSNAVKFFMGLIMKETKGNVDASAANKLLIEALRKEI